MKLGMDNVTIDWEATLQSEISVFSVLNDEEYEILKSHHSIQTFKKGEAIFGEDDIPEYMLFLIQGKVKVFKEGIGGREQIIRMAKPGGFIGYRALFAEEKHLAKAVAIEDTIVSRIDKEGIYQLLAMNPELSKRIIRSLARELGFTTIRTVTLTQKHIRGRLAESLLFLIDTYGYEEDEHTIKVYLSREDIANLSSMTTSNAIRTLSTFAQEEVIALNGKKIKVLDLDQLEKISRMG